MAKYRIVSKGNIVTIKSKLSFGEQINEREINIFERQIFRGCFRPRQEGKKTIIYTAPNVIQLTSYLKREIEKEAFYQIIAQTIEMTKRIEMNGLYMCNLMLQPELVYISERTKELFFVYQPIISRVTSGNVYAFLGDITQIAIKNSKIMKSFLTDFEMFLNDIQNYKVEHIEQYVEKKYPQVFKKIVKAETGRSGFITNDRVSYEEHYDRRHNNVDKGTILLVEEDEPETDVLSKTEEYDRETTVLQQCDEVPVLERIKTGECAEIQKSLFSIGKGTDNDFVIDNKAVSRRHAVVQIQNGDYFLIDKESTNFTYLNGSRLEKEVPYKLASNDSIRMADEEFLLIHCLQQFLKDTIRLKMQKTKEKKYHNILWRW